VAPAKLTPNAGGVRALSVALVKEVSEALDSVSHDEILRRLHSLDFEGVYSADLDDDNVINVFEELRMFYSTAAAHGNAMIVYLA